MIGNQIIQEMYPWVYFLFSMSPPTVYSVFTIADNSSGMVRKFEKIHITVHIEIHLIAVSGLNT